MNQKSSSVARRRFLKAADGIAVGLPFLESFTPRRASAASGEARLVVGANFTLGRETEPLLPFKSRLLALSGLDMQSADGGPGDQHAVGMGNMLTGRGFAVDRTLPNADGLVGGPDAATAATSPWNLECKPACATGITRSLA